MVIPMIGMVGGPAVDRRCCRHQINARIVGARRMVMKSERTWIVIADGAHAKVFQFTPEKPRLEAVKDIAFEINLRRRTTSSAIEPGRSFNSHGHARPRQDRTQRPAS